METKVSENFIEFKSSDQYGDFSVKIVKGSFYQLHMTTQTGDNEVFADVDRQELRAIRDMISKAIE